MDLLKAFEVVHQRNPNTSLEIIGDKDRLNDFTIEIMVQEHIDLYQKIVRSTASH